jgi:cell division initiation protein
MTGVDDFLEAVAADYTALYKENAILKGKLKVLVEKVEEYRSTEDAMRMALLTAQRMGEEITVEANKQKEETLRNADKMVQAKLAETAKRVADEEFRLSVAAKETAKFIALSQAIMRKHSEFLSKLEKARRTAHPDSEPPQPAPAPTTSAKTSAKMSVKTPTYEEQVADAAAQIDSAMEKLAGYN